MDATPLGFLAAVKPAPLCVIKAATATTTI
jgi:hypothetical protein